MTLGKISALIRVIKKGAYLHLAVQIYITLWVQNRGRLTIDTDELSQTIKIENEINGYFNA
ncbi:hypothetical protein H4J46_03745 [Colwellia sp. MB02u-6]|uniref:hypothetical protein n=1 Tax=Colwellia sp. MB02u-6 TaxID=2759824 RepID=UPI0015F41041|nr:hypothetical protein [Colwellia sp. MB02u-6]MBA6327068.1 hypothetical protein [Colwellia sp. MB02u-6]